MSKTRSSVKALGEIALKVTDLNKMQKFYEEVIGLTLMKRFDKIVFFRIAQGFEGHTQILALFDRDITVTQERTTLDHIAFTISLADFEKEKIRLEQCGLKVRLSEHKWVHWRSLYVLDPEGNTVEFVCYDEKV